MHNFELLKLTEFTEITYNYLISGNESTAWTYNKRRKKKKLSQKYGNGVEDLHETAFWM